MTTIIAFLAVFGLLVIIHEMGHFVTAKLSRIHVIEFGIGFPPKLFSFTRGETTYTLNAIPLGGFVKMAGEEDPSAPRSLAGKPAPIRALVISAGALMNAILPVLLFAIVFMVPKDTVAGDVVVARVSEASPAAFAGVLPGDVIYQVNGQRIENFGDLSYQLRLRTGATATMVVHRDRLVADLQEGVIAGEVPPDALESALAGVTISHGHYTAAKDVVPRWRPPDGQGATGIQIGLARAHLTDRSQSFFPAIGNGARRTVETTVLVKNEITGWFIGTSEPQLSGPVGIAQITGEVASIGILPLLELAALLSLNLAVLNILPLPALDGGRLFFLFIEVLRRGKRIPAKKEAMVHMAGFFILITAVVIISYYDILRIARGDSLLGG